MYTPGTQAVADEEAAMLEKALDKLPVNCHQVIQMRNAIVARCIWDFPNVPIYRLQLAGGKSNLATTWAEQEQFQKAIELHDEAVLQLREMIDQSIVVTCLCRRQTPRFTFGQWVPVVDQVAKFLGKRGLNGGQVDRLCGIG